MKAGWAGMTLVLLLGAMAGTLLGQIVAAVMPAGAARDFFFKGISVGLKEPLNLDLSMLQVVFGITLSVNPVTLVGLLCAALLLLKFKK